MIQMRKKWNPAGLRKPMQSWIIVVVLSAIVSSLPAQPANFRQAVQAIRQQVFGADTALYNEKKISFLAISENGNIQVATGANSDTLFFNLLLLHPIILDSNSIYNQYGFNLYENSLGLFVEQTMQHEEYNEKGETVVIRTILPAYDLEFGDAASAKITADALIRLRSYCKPDKNSYRLLRR
jgi:hypothetical protein